MLKYRDYQFLYAAFGNFHFLSITPKDHNQGDSNENITRHKAHAHKDLTVLKCDIAN